MLACDVARVGACLDAVLFVVEFSRAVSRHSTLTTQAAAESQVLHDSTSLPFVFIISQEYQNAFYAQFNREAPVLMRDCMIRPIDWNR
jgi:hypothetical protein